MEMISRAPRFLLAFSSVLLVAGAAIHAAAFRHAAAAIAESNLRPFFGNSSKSLWLGDSATLAGVALLCGLIALRPSAATRPVVMLVAFIPAATAVLIYVFLGSFFAGHLLMISAAAILVAGLQFPASKLQAR
jgi:hypothetical protein